MELRVSIQVDGRDVSCGTLYTNVRRGVESCSFVYADSYLANKDAFSLSPDLPLGPGVIHGSSSRLFGAFEDCMPDRWGRNLLLRAERNAARDEGRAPRTLFEANMLARVSDYSRQGAIRIWADGTAVAPMSSGVPKEIDLPRLLSLADRASEDMNADIRDLLRAGSSLGGARPKASMFDERGRLCIAKFPKADESLLEDTCAWEHVALTLAARCGIRVPETRLIRIDGRAVLILVRFDRDGEKRIPYTSGLTAIQGRDGGDFSYLELVDFLEMEGSTPTEDIRQLWVRILFSCAIGNTDDHMRNHGFLREKSGWWLSPAFDVNPTPGTKRKYLSCSIDFDERLADPAVAIGLCEPFRISRADARREAHAMAAELSSWRRVAQRDGISKASLERMAGCLDAGIERLKAV